MRDNDKQPEEKHPPGEQPPGKFHYNPGNMAGKTVNDVTPPKGERTNTDRSIPDTDKAERRRPD